MPFETLLAAAGVTLLVIGTPGPANIAQSAMGAAYGFRSVNFALAVPTGFLFNCLLAGILFWGAGSMATHPVVIWILRLVGCAYLSLLCWKIWTATISGNDAGAPRAALGLIIHPLNPKAYFFLITIFGQFVLPAAASGTSYWTAAGFILVEIFILGFIVNMGWWLIGCMLGSALSNERQHRIVNRFMAGALALTTAHLLISGVTVDLA